MVPTGEALGCVWTTEPVLSAPTLSSPTRIGRPVWQGLLMASRRTRTAVTQRQRTPPAAMRDASLRPLHTATKATLLPEQRILRW